MMSRVPNMVAGVVVIAILGWIGWAVAQKMYVEPRAEKLEAIEELEQTLDDVQQRRREMPSQRSQLQAWADRTLGSNVESVDHRLRSRLNRLAEYVGLQQPVVSTGNAAAVGSPAKSRFPRRGPQARLRDEIDFVTVEGSISASGSFEQVLQLVDAIEREPWLKRIDRVSLSPKDNGSTFDVSLGLTTLFLPGRSPDDAPDAASPSVAASAPSASLASLSTANPFHLPPPRERTPEPDTPENQPQRSTPPPFPYDQWRVVGITANGNQPEVWVRNLGTGERKLLSIEDSVGEAVLVRADNFTATFTMNDREYEVIIGRTLADRNNND